MSENHEVCNSKISIHALPYVRVCSNQIPSRTTKLAEVSNRATIQAMYGTQGHRAWLLPALGSGAQQQHWHQQAASKLRAWEEKQRRKQEKAARHERMARQQRNRIALTRHRDLRALEQHGSQLQSQQLPPPLSVLPPLQLQTPPPQLEQPLPEQQALPTSSVQQQQQQAEQTPQPHRKHNAPPSGRALQVLPEIRKLRKISSPQGKGRRLKQSQPAVARASLPVQHFVEDQEKNRIAAVIAPHSLIPVFGGSI